jgi:hypothetical protein
LLLPSHTPTRWYYDKSNKIKELKKKKYVSMMIVIHVIAHEILIFLLIVITVDKTCILLVELIQHYIIII